MSVDLSEKLNRFPVIIRNESGFINVLKMLHDHPGFGTYFSKYCQTYIHIIQIGAGGTGSYTAAETLRMIGGFPEAIQNKIFFTLIDGDVFEPKNLGRQLCCNEDLGVNKASAIISNYGPLYNCKETHLSSIPEYVTSAAQLTQIAFGIPNFITEFAVTKDSTIIKDKESYPVLDEFRERNSDSFRDALENTIARSGANSVPEVHKYFHDFIMDTMYSRNDQEKFEQTHCTRSDNNNFVSGNQRLNIIPIIVDCVDKTTPRLLVEQIIKEFIYHASLKDSIAETALTAFQNILMDSAFESHTKVDYDVYMTPSMGILYTNKGDKSNNIASYRSARYAHRAFVYTSSREAVHSVYLISSGNGKYSGQVAWGRYSTLFGCGRPISYKDVFGEEKVSSRFSKDKNQKYDNMACFDLPPINFDITTSRPGLEERIKVYGLKANGIKIGTVDFNNGVTFEPNVNLTETSLRSLYYFTQNAVLRETRPENGSTNIIDIFEKYPGNVYIPEYEWILDPDNDNDGATAAWIPHEGYCSTLVRKYYNAGGLPGQLVIDATTGKQVKCEDMYKNFVDYASQYISVPLPYSRYKDLVDIRIDQREEQMSCAERAEENIQSINANKTAANLILNYLGAIINGTYGLDGGAVTRLDNAATSFNTLESSYANENITNDMLLMYDDIHNTVANKDMTTYNYLSGKITLEEVFKHENGLDTPSSTEIIEVKK